MKIITVGMSPYNLISKGKLNAKILEKLVSSYPDISSFVWGHDNNYYVPEENEKYYYKSHETKIEIFPFKLRQAATQIYDLIRQEKPNILITIGDMIDFSYMSAIRMFFPVDKLKWFFVLTSSVIDFGDSAIELLRKTDGILCTNKHTFEALKPHYPKPLLNYCFTGSGIDIEGEKLHSEKTVMSNCKRGSQENLAMIIEAITQLDGFKLYAHTNMHEIIPEVVAAYDMNNLRLRFDPDEKFLRLPEKYVSTVDGLTEKELSEEYLSAGMFISIPVSGSTGMTVFEALKAGCWPILNNCDLYKELANLLENYFEGELKASDFLIESIPILTHQDSYVYVPDPKKLKEKIINAEKKMTFDKGLSKKFSEFSKGYDGVFYQILEEMLDRLQKTGPSLCLEISP